MALVKTVIYNNYLPFYQLFSVSLTLTTKFCLTGATSGLEGEIFGANMILVSTIERNHTTKSNHIYEQKLFQQNKIKKEDKTIKYIVLSDLQTDEIQNNFEKTPKPIVNKTKSYIRVNTPHSHIEHDVGLHIQPRKPKDPDISSEKEIVDFSLPENVHTTTEKTIMNLWNLVNQAGHEGKFKVNKKSKPFGDNPGSSTRGLGTISEYETPPPPGQTYIAYLDQNPNMEKQVIPQSIYNVNQDFPSNVIKNKNKVTGILPDVETPPPPAKDTKVYGQWTSSKFAGNVLNYLKSINFYDRDKKTPSTNPFHPPRSKMTSDNYPYASEFKYTKLHPPVKFQRKNFRDKMRLRKRGIPDEPQINVQIIEEDLRDIVLKQHAQTKPKDVQITNRGNPAKEMIRFHRDADGKLSTANSESTEETTYKSKPFNVASAQKRNKVYVNYDAQKNNNLKNIAPKKKSKVLADFDSHRNNNLMTILPFLKSLEYFVDDSYNTGSGNVIRSSHINELSKKKLSNMYSKSLSNANKWHNMKSYSNDYTPRRINVDSNEDSSSVDLKIAELNKNKKHPSIRLKYKHESHKVIENNEDPTILKGRELAMSVSNQSNSNKESISIVKYNHGFLPSHEQKSIKSSDKIAPSNTNQEHRLISSKKENRKTNFDKHVKLGNALNEQHVIGYNEQQKKLSFIGGDENIPDINRYRSDLDKEVRKNVPPSLGLRKCKNLETDERALYVQADLSIDTSHIMSPIKQKNTGIEFIQQNYKRCSLAGSFFEKSSLLFINWSKTPVRLFGGAYPKTTTDLCGFFK